VHFGAHLKLSSARFISLNQFAVAGQNPKNRIRRRIVRCGAVAIGDVDKARRIDSGEVKVGKDLRLVLSFRPLI
jgi:hypothetical protein